MASEFGSLPPPTVLECGPERSPLKRRKKIKHFFFNNQKIYPAVFDGGMIWHTPKENFTLLIFVRSSGWKCVFVTINNTG